MNRRVIVKWRGGAPVQAYYEAGKSDPQRKQRRERGSADRAVHRAGASLREQARHLDQNHDLARGALNTLVQNIVGPHGIQVEPQPRTRSGEIHDDLANQIQQLYDDWSIRPEVTWTHDWASAQRIACRTWLRDGEMLAQTIGGLLPTLDHGTRVPYSIELIEPDLLPLEFNTDSNPRIIAGIEVNGWKRPVAYHIYKHHPGDARLFLRGAKIKRVSADRILHLKLIDRIGQMRGVSIFASIMLRLDDIKDYEESERIAAKVAASMSAYIRKGAPDTYEPVINDAGEITPRDLKFRPGMIFDDLTPGEEIGTIDTNRPNTQLEPHRNGQLRAAASGISLTYSSLSKDYNGTYSAQRQELVEGYGAYGVLSSEFIGQFVRPNYLRLIELAQLSGLLTLPADIDALTLGDALYVPPQMPWIDPVKESVAWANLEDNLYASGPEIIRRRGLNPKDVLDNQRRWEERKKQLPSKQDSAAPGGNSSANAMAFELIKSEQEQP